MALKTFYSNNFSDNSTLLLNRFRKQRMMEVERSGLLSPTCVFDRISINEKVNQNDYLPLTTRRNKLDSLLEQEKEKSIFSKKADGLSMTVLLLPCQQARPLQPMRSLMALTRCLKIMLFCP